MFKNKKGSNALGIVGIVITIVLFEILAGYFTVAITNDNVKNIFVSNCDCGLLGCSAYLATNGANALYDKCESQVETNPVLQDALNNKFWNMTIVSIIIIFLNITLIFIVILIIRGVPG
jgi:hypothetical protein